LNVTPENWLKERLKVLWRFCESLSKFTTVSDNIYFSDDCGQGLERQRKTEKDRERQRKTKKDKERQRKT
jgi:hypothetical protein